MIFIHVKHSPPPLAGVLLCSDAADVTRDTVSGMIEDSTGSELLSKLYTGGMNAADFAAQTLATGGASSFGNLAKGLVAVTKALGDDFVRMFIKSYGDDAVKAIAAHGDDMGKLALHSTDDAAKLLLSSSDDVGKAALSYTDDAGKTLLSSGDDMIDDWYGIIDDTVDGAAKSWDDVANSIDDAADDALAGKPNTGYNGSTGVGDSKIPWDSWQNYEKVTTNGQEYAKVGDRLYSRHAVDRMQPSGKRFTVGDAIVQAGGVSGRSVAPQFVEDIINSVKPIFQPATSNYIYSSGTVKIVTNEYGYVVTIMTVG